MKLCKKCKHLKELSEFYSRPANTDGLSGSCKGCARAQDKVYREANPGGIPVNPRRVGRDPESVRRARLWTWHRMTVEEFEQMLDDQGGCCKICGSEDPRGKNWHVDHDHNCCASGRSCGECTRGLLCGRCNVMLGMADDNIETLVEAVRYLSDFNALQGALAAPA